MNLPAAMFTVAQWQELEHQALIFKYLKAGLTVPPDLLAPIRSSLLRLGYYSYNGKKIEPEPGRCRRTDGKKWRCSRDVHLDSKYCERHMIRRRYRSRKPVESSLSQSQSGTIAASEVTKKHYGFGLNSEADEHNFLHKDLGTERYQGHFTPDGMWSHMSHIASSTVSESRNSSVVVSNCFHQQTVRDVEPLNIDAARSEQHVSSGHLSSAGCLKQEYQSTPLFTDWHWKKDLGRPATEYGPNKDFICNPDVNVDCSGSL